MEQNSINFLRDSLAHHRDTKNSLDQKASFLVAVSGIIFGLSVGRLQEVQFLVLAISSFFTIFLSILIIRLPFRGITKEKIGLMFWWFLDKSFDQYKRELDEVFTSDEKISQEYIKEIWNLANYSLKPKSRLLKWASFILVFGLLGGFVLFFI